MEGRRHRRFRDLYSLFKLREFGACLCGVGKNQWRGEIEPVEWENERGRGGKRAEDLEAVGGDGSNM